MCETNKTKTEYYAIIQKSHRMQISIYPVVAFVQSQVSGKTFRTRSTVFSGRLPPCVADPVPDPGPKGPLGTAPPARASTIIPPKAEVREQNKWAASWENKHARFGPVPAQTWLHSHRSWLEAWNLGLRNKIDCTSYVAKTNELISFAVTTMLILVFVFAYAKRWFSHDTANLRMLNFVQ